MQPRNASERSGVQVGDVAAAELFMLDHGGGVALVAVRRRGRLGLLGDVDPRAVKRADGVPARVDLGSRSVSISCPSAQGSRDHKVRNVQSGGWS